MSGIGKLTLPLRARDYPLLEFIRYLCYNLPSYGTVAQLVRAQDS